MRKNANHVAAWFQIVVGVCVFGWWITAAMTDGIVEVNEGRSDILFHVAAELLMAGLLVAAGLSILRRGRTPQTTMLSGLALGSLLYSSVNSPGYFAQRGEWPAVAMFAVLLVAGAGAVVSLTSVGARVEPDRAQPSAETAGTVGGT